MKSFSYTTFDYNSQNPFTIPKIILTLKLHVLIANLEKQIKQEFNVKHKKNENPLPTEQLNLRITQKGFLNQLARLDLNSTPEDRKEFIAHLQKLYEYTPKNTPQDIKNFIALIFKLCGDVDNDLALEKQATTGNRENVSQKLSKK